MEQLMDRFVPSLSGTEIEISQFTVITDDTIINNLKH